MNDIVSLLAAFAVSFAVSAVAGYFLVPALRAFKAGQSIREEGPKWHAVKAGTPTMGGIMFIIGILAAVLFVGMKQLRAGQSVGLIVFLFSLVFGIIGFIDDFVKVKKKQNLGLTSLQKLILQLAAAVVFVVLLRYLGYLTPNLYVPFIGVTIPLPELVYFVFAAFVIVGCVNAVNLTDGVDGLVSGVTIPVGVFFAAAACAWANLAAGIFAAALVGGLAAFLIFNYHPAKVFMGDTGSLFLGGAVCGLAFALDMPLVLIPVGIIYIAETLSDILQVAYFKITHGKRIFKMAPLHHHFELCGWSEYKLFWVFSGITAVMCIISYIAVAGRYAA